VLRYRSGQQPDQWVVTTFGRRIEASTDAVWAVISDPYAMVKTDPHVQVVSTYGVPGEVGSRYRVKGHGLTMEREIVEAVAGERLAFRQVYKDGRPGPEQRGDLRRDGDATVLTWTVTEPPLPWGLSRVSALTIRFGVPRWLSRLERQVAKSAQ
jgi:hypothetical protein